MISRRALFLPGVLYCALLLSGTLARAAEPPASPPPAASPAPASPESVVQSYLETMKAGQFVKMAELMHPEALEKFRTMMLAFVDEAKPDGEDNPLQFFQGVKDVASLKKLSPTEFFASFFGGLMDLNPGVKDALGSASMGMTALGSVPEGDVLHVVCRTSAGVEGLSVTKMEVLSLKRAGGNWRVLLSGEMEGLAQSLRASNKG